MRRIVLVSTLVAGAALALALGCGEITGTTPADGEAAADAGAGAPAPTVPAAPGPYGIACWFFHRDLGVEPVPPHQAKTLRFSTGAPSVATFDLPGIEARGEIAPVADDPSAVLLAIELPGSHLRQEFRLLKDRRPTNELVGGEGFTGLNYVSTPGSNIDLQYICGPEPFDPNAPAPLDGRPVDPGDPSAPPFPVRVRCEVSSGALSETVTIEGSVGKKVVFGSRAVAISFREATPYEQVRTLVLQLVPNAVNGSAAPEAWAHQQLLQLVPGRALVNPTTGPSGLTGRSTLVATTRRDGGTDDPISVGCTAE